MKEPWINRLISKPNFIAGSDRGNSDLSPSDELRRDLAATRLVVIVGFVIGIVVILAWHSQEPKIHVLVLWALACFASGALTGFLFGIPRVLQKPIGFETSRSESATGTPPALSSYELIINTNLDDVSDWLTKIIVGIGLVEIRKQPNRSILQGKHLWIS
jgi:hypothetical protein